MLIMLTEKVQQLARDSVEKARRAEEFARRRKEEEKQRLNVEINLISNETFQQHHGLDLASTVSTDLSAAKIYNVLGASTLAEFILKIASENGSQLSKIRFWFMANRQNKTIRPDYPLENHTETFDQIIKKQHINARKICLWVELMEPEKSIWPPREGFNSEILLFLKHYDGLRENMTGVCHIYIRKNDKASDLFARIIQIMNWPSSTQIILFEVFI